MPTMLDVRVSSSTPSTTPGPVEGTNDSFPPLHCSYMSVWRKILGGGGGGRG